MRKLLFPALLLTSIFFLPACLKDAESEGEVKSKENDQQIQQYMATNPNVGFQRAPSNSGLYYAVTQANSAGSVPKTGDQVNVRYVGSLLNGTVFDKTDTAKNETLLFALNANAVVTGFNEGVSLLKKGEKGAFLLPSYLAYGSQQNSTIAAYSVLRFDVELVDVRTEDELLSAYGDSLQAVPRGSGGLLYALRQEGTGNGAATGNRVNVRFRGYFADGREFARTGTYEFVIGSNNPPAIEGWQQGIPGMKVGEKATLLIPSRLAYGDEGARDSQGNSVIPLYTPLIYDLEILAIN